MKINYISQNEKWREKKKSITVLYLVKKILYGGFKFSKINFSFAFRKKKTGHQKRKKGQMCISSKQSDFCISSIIVNYFKNKNNGSCNYI